MNRAPGTIALSVAVAAVALFFAFQLFAALLGTIVGTLGQ